jgi:hypothetical protein
MAKKRLTKNDLDKILKKTGQAAYKYDHVQQGIRQVAGNDYFFRSKAEANYARYLEFLREKGNIIAWHYEPVKFVFKERTGTNHYTPDFKVFVSEWRYEWHEVKGYMDPKSKTKIKRFKRDYPREAAVLKIVTGKDVAKIGQQIGGLCDGWE